MLEGKISVHERILRILFSTNQGLYAASAMVNDKGVVTISYEVPNLSHSFDKMALFELDCNQRTIHFSLPPRGSLTEQECIELVADLKGEGYRIEGESFLTPRFKPHEISIY